MGKYEFDPVQFWVIFTPAFIALVLAIINLIWNYKNQNKIEVLKAKEQKGIHIHKLQFDKEFEIYKELWALLIDLRSHVYLLRPKLDYGGNGKNYEETIKERLKTSGLTFNKIVEVIQKNKPFYSSTVYNASLELLKICNNELIEVQYNEKNTKEYWENGEKNILKISSAIDSICETIRERIGMIEVLK